MKARIAKGRVVDKLKRGQIVWADFVDPQGKDSGLHPAMIITSNEDIERGEPIFAVVISTKLKYAKKEEMIEMRYLDKRLGRGGHPVTKLDKKCAAICKWVKEIKKEDIKAWGGTVYGSDLERIIKLVHELKELRHS